MSKDQSPVTEKVAPLLSEKDFRRLLGGIGERTFHELRAAGIVPAPLELRPRVPRWTHDDYIATIQRLPRRERAAEPATLASGRRARIDAMKAGSSSAKRQLEAG